jgi:alkylresorcinol/alkylpyrone synthase
MARIVSIATVVPEHRVDRAETMRRAADVFGGVHRGANHLLAMIERTGVEHRYFTMPLEEILRDRPLAQKSQEYHDHALRLALDVATRALARAGLAARDIDHVITVSCTGVMIPSLDAELMNCLPFRTDCRRTPITELGCAAGAVGLSRAHDHVQAHPGETALLIAVELSSLTFQHRDTSMANVVASSIFGDGAAAAVVTGRPARDGRGGVSAAAPCAEILDTRSELFPDTQYIMGFDLRDGGFHIKLDRDIVPLLEREFDGLLERFLAPHHVARGDLGFFALHPGGRRLLEVMEQVLGVGRDKTFASWDVLRDHGNMSSVTVLFVLERLLREAPPRPGALGLLAAFGPGFSAETVLLRWG